MMMQRRFATLDVFTRRRFTGNPLAVVLDAEGLDATAMQAIAREFGHPETVFVLPPQDRANRARLRIFTPARELPFAGHPTVGTAVLLARLDGGADERSIVLEENIGPITCQVAMNDGDCGRARFDLASEPVEAGEIHDAALVAAALNLTLDDLGNERFVPGIWSAGMPVTFVPLHGLDAVARAAPNAAVWDEAFGPEHPPAVYVFTSETSDPAHDFHARMFAPRLGVPEDPATGSAAAGLAGIIARDGGLADGTYDLTIEQGYEMKRPSLIELSISLRGGRLAAASIGGEAIVVTEGMIAA